MKLLALAGPKGGGKSTLASMLYRTWPELRPGTVLKVYSFAAPIKDFCRDVLGLSARQLYGSDEEKNTPTPYRWGRVPNYHLLPEPRPDPEGFITARRLMQHFGTEVWRHMHEGVWTDCLLRKVAADGPALAVVDDCRFPNEADAVRAAGGKIVGLTRRPHAADGHVSENALAGYEFDGVVDNANLGQGDAFRVLLSYLQDWGWLS